MSTANTNEAQAALHKRLVEEMTERRRKALLNLLDNADFRTFFAWLQERTGVYTDVFYGNSKDTYEKGKRAVGLMLLGEILQLGEAGLEFRHAADKQYAHERNMLMLALLEKDKEGKCK